MRSADRLGSAVAPEPETKGLSQPFPLLALPVECVTRVMSYVDSLTDRASLQRAVDTDEFHDRVVCNPKAYRFETVVCIVLLPADDGRAALHTTETSDKIGMIVKYGKQVQLFDPLDLPAFASICPSRLEVFIGVQPQIADFMHCFHACLRLFPNGFLGTRFKLWVQDDGINQPNVVHRQAIPVANLLSTGLRSRLRSLRLLFLNKRDGDSISFDRFSEQCRLLEMVAPTALCFQQQTRTAVLWCAVPVCLNLAGTGTLDQLTAIKFANQPLCSHVLVALLGKLPSLTDLWCSVIYLPGTDVPHRSFDRLRRLTIDLVGFPDEDGDLCDISDDECDFYRRLLVACRMAHAVTFLFDADFTIGFFNTIVHTFIATRRCQWPQPKIEFEVRESWLRRAIYRRVCLHAPADFIVYADGDATAYRIHSRQLDNLLRYLPDAIRPIFTAIGGDIEELCAADLVTSVEDTDALLRANLTSAQLSVRLEGWPLNQLFTVTLKQRKA